MNNKKQNKSEPSRFAKKANDIVDKIDMQYKQKQSELHPYSFTANQYRILSIFGIFLILFALIKGINPKEVNCKNNDGVLKNISNTVSNSKDSLFVLYNLYKNGGLNTVSEFAKIKNINSNQKFHINLVNTDDLYGIKNVLVCDEKIHAKISIANNSNTNNEIYKTLDVTIGEEIQDNPYLEHALLRLSEGDKATIVFSAENNTKTHDSIVLSVTDIIPQEKHILDFYEVYEVFDGVLDALKCGSVFFATYDLYDASENKIINKMQKISSILKISPILLQRTLTGKSTGSKVKIVTKMRNLCVFKEGESLDSCNKFWNFASYNPDSVIILTITISDDKNK